MNNNNIAITPAKVKQVTKVDAKALEANPVQATADTNVNGSGTRNDDRNKFFFRVKIGGSSQPSTAIEPTFSATFDDLMPKSTNTDVKPQSAPTDISQTKDGYTFGNPFAPPGSQAKFTNSFDPTKSLPELEVAKAISDKTVKVEVPGENPTSGFSGSFEIQAEKKNLPDTARELIFDSSLGQILGVPYIRLSSYQHSSAKFTVLDPEDKLREEIAKLGKVEIEAGFVNGYTRNIFVGTILNIGRQLPNGTVVEAVDQSYQLQQTTSDAIASTPSVTPATTGTSTVTAGDTTSSDYKVKSTLTGEASFYGHGDGFDGKKTANGEIFNASKLTAAHKTLPFGTMLKVTYPKTGKITTVRVNDRGPYSGNRILDLSYAAAKELGMVSDGHGVVKIDILEKNTQPQPKTQAAIASATQNVGTLHKAPDTGSTANTKTAFQLSQQNGTFARKSNAENIASDANNLKFSQTSVADLKKQGEVIFQQSKMSSAEMEAALTGNVLVARGNTLTSVGPGEGKPSGVVLDYNANRAVFIGYPTITQRTQLHLQSGFGAVTVQGWDVNNKQTIGATVVTPAPVMQHPTGIIQAPEWGSIKLNDPIIPGSPYTWADATKNGTRVPANKEIMQGIVRIATILTELTPTTGQKKFLITSWYRDPKSNRRVGGATNSRHMYGDGVDFYFPGPQYAILFNKLHDTWPGGVAKGRPPRFNPGFIHLDARHLSGLKRERWNY